MAAAFSPHANACVAEYSDHNYYMFSVFNRDQTSPAYLYDIASYWQKNAFLLGKPECLPGCLREVESQCLELRLEARTATDSAIADPAQQCLQNL